LLAAASPRTSPSSTSATTTTAAASAAATTAGAAPDGQAGHALEPHLANCRRLKSRGLLKPKRLGKLVGEPDNGRCLEPVELLEGFGEA